MKRLACLCCLLLACTVASAQAPKVWRLDLRKVADIPQGRAAMVDGKAGPQPQRFLVDGLTAYTPVVVSLRALERGDDIVLRLGKTSWEQTLREGSTREGQASFRIRTEGEFLIEVRADAAERPYKLLVWVGDEVRVAPPPAVLPKSELEAESSGGLPGGAVLWVIAAALLGIFALLLVVVLRRKPR